MPHNILIIAFVALEILATFQSWIPAPKINLQAAGLACFALSLIV